MSDTEGVEFLRLAKTIRHTPFLRITAPTCVASVARELTEHIVDGLPGGKNVEFRIIIEARVEE